MAGSKHNQSLIDTVLVHLRKKYRKQDHVFHVESPLWTCPIRAIPDIAVYLDKSLLCVVEIGYTRPEKLKAYLKLCSDVRWYDRDGKLQWHSKSKPKHEHVKVIAKLEPAGVFHVKSVMGVVECQSDECLEESRFPSDALVQRCEWWRGSLREELSLAVERRNDEALDYLRDDVLTWVVTNGIKSWQFCYCDKCGESWRADPCEPYGALQISQALEERGQLPGSVQVECVGTWGDVVAWICENTGISKFELHYEDGDWIGDARGDILASIRDRNKSHRGLQVELA